MHNNSNDSANNMVVNYMGALYQSLLDMADWLQTGKEPLKTTSYERGAARSWRSPTPPGATACRPGCC